MTPRFIRKEKNDKENENYQLGRIPTQNELLILQKEKKIEGKIGAFTKNFRTSLSLC